ncbi:MAG TPA: hypothetical protein VEQ85_10135, partial [Lacipirellulaceae bacterium]|nr:hypothetical protein [Lacipirellulaceae bacterium]
MARKRSRREVDDDELDAEDEGPAEARPPRRRRPHWRRRFVGFVAGVLALALAGPTIVGKTPLRNLLLSSALPPAAARLSSADASFSWVAGQSLTGVTLTDASGAPIATIESATIDRSLVALAANNRHLGKIVVTRPVLNLQTHPGGSNVETVIAAIAAAAAPRDPSNPEGAPDGPTLGEIEVSEGVILGRDAATGQAWRIDGLALTARPTAAGDWEAAGAGTLSLVAVPGEAVPGAPFALTPA